MQVQVSTLSDLPLQFMRSLLWELYELNFRYELYALDRFIVLHLWTTSDEAQTSCQTLIYSIFPGESGLVMWSEPLPQDVCELGFGASDMATALPFFNSFRELLSAWPGVPDHLQFPAELDGKGNMAAFDLVFLAIQFYVQTAFDFLGQQPSLPQIFSFV